MGTSTVKNNELTALCAAAYFAAVLDAGLHFPVEGETILRRPGYRDYDWVMKLLSTMRPLLQALPGAQPDDPPELRKLRGFLRIPDDEFDALLSHEIVATLCLADNVLSAMYHEYILRQQCQFLAKTHADDKDTRAQLRHLRTAAEKFRKLKAQFLGFAFQGQPGPKQLVRFDARVVDRVCPAFADAFIAAPVVLRHCPRHLTADWSQITNLRTKFRHEIALCEQTRAADAKTSLTLMGLDFEVSTNGKF